MEWKPAPVLLFYFSLQINLQTTHDEKASFENLTLGLPASVWPYFGLNFGQNSGSMFLDKQNVLRHIQTAKLNRFFNNFFNHPTITLRYEIGEPLTHKPIKHPHRYRLCPSAIRQSTVYIIIE